MDHESNIETQKPQYEIQKPETQNPKPKTWNPRAGRGGGGGGGRGEIYGGGAAVPRKVSTDRFQAKRAHRETLCGCLSSYTKFKVYSVIFDPGSVPEESLCLLVRPHHICVWNSSTLTVSHVPCSIDSGVVGGGSSSKGPLSSEFGTIKPLKASSWS